MRAILTDRVFQVLLLLAIVTPYVSRIPGAMIYGPHWLNSFLAGGIFGFLFLAVFDAIPVVVLYKLWRLRPDSKTALGLGGLTMVVVLGLFDGTVDLASDAQAALVLVIAPVYASIMLSIAWGLGLLIDRFARK